MKQMNDTDYIISEESKVDVAIVGGGLVGQALALAIAPYVESIMLIDRVDLSDMALDSFDARAMALAYNALCILKGLGLWEKLSPHCEPIHKVHVSNKGLLGRVVLDHKKVHKPCLGAICAFPQLYAAMHQQLLKEDRIQLMAPAEILSLDTSTNQIILINNKLRQNVSANLVIACDGARSAIRNQLGIEVEHTDYQSYALVCNIELKRSHQNYAYERFYDDGIVAMLPMTGNRSACVFTFAKGRKNEVEAMTDEGLCDYLQNLFGYRLGKFIKVGKRDIFPLHLMVANQLFSNNVLLFGNAAHFLHPVAGQGFNLCLRDIAVFADLVNCFGIGSDNRQLLEAFEKSRVKDHKQTIWVSNQLVNFFSNNIRAMKLSRSLGLHLTDRLPIGKSLINRLMMGDMIQLPTLAKQRVHQWEI
ncbi:FAD-dependent monooxygenase [Thiotrichales bacterium 19S3-7]|nr:FAD-dependent monooxygenase [Thiotrichales bacterium 19S3-7]MCF6800743.1 FAD-dependent monooxygenase [Thiotrichales bacterium 19S3-11]